MDVSRPKFTGFNSGFLVLSAGGLGIVTFCNLPVALVCGFSLLGSDLEGELIALAKALCMENGITCPLLRASLLVPVLLPVLLRLAVRPLRLR
jgi:hypothetical protein